MERKVSAYQHFGLLFFGVGVQRCVVRCSAEHRDRRGEVFIFD